MTMKHKESLFWMTWLMPVIVFFSIAGFFHHYYLIMLAPPVAALVGAGWYQLWRCYRSDRGWCGYLLPTAVIVTAIFEWYIMRPSDATIGSGWSLTVLAGGLLSGALLLILRKGSERLTQVAGAAAIIFILIGPLYWSATPITYGQSSQLPEAGPSDVNDLFIK